MNFHFSDPKFNILSEALKSNVKKSVQIIIKKIKIMMKKYFIGAKEISLLEEMVKLV